MFRRLLMPACLVLGAILPMQAVAANHQIAIQGFLFTPSKVKVNYGDTVTWTNMDGVPHTATSTGGSPKSFSSGSLATGQKYSVVINPVDGRGPFPYFCAVHPEMVDTIFVATTHTIQIVDFDFVPAGLTINPGDTIVWVNLDFVDHTATSDPSSPKSWDSGLLPQGDEYQLVFTSGDGMGPFPYHCAPHPAMKDTLRINSLFCCQGTTGNVNTVGIVDLSDLSLLIAYLTQTPKPALPCQSEANVNNAGIVDLSDLSLLIAYLTAPVKPTLPNCPS